MTTSINAGFSGTEITTPIDTLRGQIDALDTAIINLIAERARISEVVQTVRINGGGPRVELSRERQIMDAYKHRLGHHGTELADAVLRFCRGEH